MTQQVDILPETADNIQKIGRPGAATVFFLPEDILMIEFPAEFLYMFSVRSRGESGGDTLRWIFITPDFLSGWSSS
jgi:hypothetical protein